MSQSVDVRVEMMEILTYQPGPDSPYPAFVTRKGGGRYPYSVRTDMSNTARPMVHRTVVLENRYVRAVVLPDLGGRLFRLYDKVAGKDTFLVPPSLKFQNVSARGAWLAGGVEFNFGFRGHTVNTVSPVAWAVRRGPDGSASVWVGSLIMPIESRWALKITLRPERSVLDLEIHAAGPMVLPGLMYWWTNAGVEVSEGSRFYYFGLHSNDVRGRHSWPVADGVDLSWYRNRYVGSDMFLQEPQRDYMGFYDFARGHGLAQTADRFEAPGQKYFTWGTHPEGRYWDVMFSDSGQTYCEIQRGRHATQHVTDALGAMTEDVWTEQWAPIAGTDGFSAMESDLVLSVVEPTETAGPAGAADIHLLALRPMRDLHLQAEADGQSLGRWIVAEAAPDRPFRCRADLPAGRHVGRVRVLDSAGKVLLDWERFEFLEADWHKHGHDDPQQGPDTPDKLFAQAERERFQTWPLLSPDSDELYDKVLAMDPHHAGALRVKAEMGLHNGLPEQALEHLDKALHRTPLDCDLLALKGWALLRTGRHAQVAEAFAQAARKEPVRRRGLFGLSCAHLKAGDLDGAAAAAERLLAWRPNDKWGRLIQTLVLRRSGRKDRAAEILKGLLEEDPLWSHAHAEALLLGLPADLGDGKRKIGDDSVSAAGLYLELGLYDDAQAILEADESNEPFSPAVRLAHLAYARHRLGDADGAARALADLSRSPVEYAHVWAAWSFPVLEELTGAYPREGRLALMLGNLLASRGRVDQAETHWQRAADLGLEYSVVYRNLALAASLRGDDQTALGQYRRAWRLADFSVHLFTEFDRFLAGLGLHEERLGVYAQLPPDLRERSAVALRRVAQLLDAQRYEEAYRELTSRTFLRSEYERGLRFQYMESLIGLALPMLSSGRLERALDTLGKGLEYPRNLNVGRHGESPNESPIHYLLGLAAEMSGDEAQAREHWTAAAHELHGQAILAEAYEMLAWLALGNRPRAVSIAHHIEQAARGDFGRLDRWFHMYNTPGTMRLVHGLVQVFKGQIEQARRIWREAVKVEPDCRFLRLHLDMPGDLLERMARKVTGQAVRPAEPRPRPVPADRPAE